MSSQWGRGGGGAAGRGTGVGGLLFVAFVSLVIGGAAGYGVFRTMDRHAGSDEIAFYEERLVALSRDLDAATAAKAESERTAQELTEANASSRRQIESLRETIASLEAAAKTAPPAQDDGQAARAGEIRALERRLADAEAYRQRAEEEVRQRDRRLSLQADEAARLKQALEDVRTAGDAEQRVAADRLRKENDELRRSVEDANAELARARNTDIPALSQELEQKARDLAEASELNRTLTARLAALEEEALKARAAEEPADGSQAIDNAEPANGRNPRNATLVARAMQDTPGLDRLSQAQRTRLEQTLTEGECVTNALAAVFSRVPVLTLRNLMRDLDSDC